MTNKSKKNKIKKEKPLKTWGDVDRYMKSLGYRYVKPKEN
jgi:hypothetical protein